ncbi:MAG TPA: hypothetical protein VGP95_00610 [Gemmatimonadaceae bacterium]|jgi:hypothetical protein|nr:hypothetical protein [Gemmatimonadaceae bacterium]
MKATMFQPRKRQRAPIAWSIGIHVILIGMIASITFRYPIAEFFGPRRPTDVTERIRYVETRPAVRQPIGNGSSTTKEPPKRAVKPAPLLAPTLTPSALPPVAPPTVSVGSVSGTTGGTGGAPAGVATGVEPALPDPRIELRPNPLRLPLTQAQRNDSAVKAIYVAYREAEVAAEEHKGRDPRDWTFEKGGQKYGIDSQYVYLGKFKIPSMILAALPFNYAGVDGSRIIQARNSQWIQNDIYMHSQGMSEDDFRAAVRRIRERKEREKRDTDDKDKSTKPSPIVP